MTDRHERMQPMRPEVNENLVGQDIAQLWMFDEEDRTTILQWCRGIVVAMLPLRLGTGFTFNGVKISYVMAACQLVRRCLRYSSRMSIWKVDGECV